MNQQKIFFNKNLKFLRERRKWSQTHLAAILGITRAKLAALEIGNTKAPPPEDYIQISNVFKISIDTLLKIDISQIGELKLRALEAGNDVYIKGGNLRILAISVDTSNNEQVEYIPIKAKAGYVAGYNDPTFIASLPKYSIPNLPKHGTYRVFPTKGDSMLPIPENSDIIAKYIEDWTSIKPGSLCIVILKTQQDLVFKQVYLDIQKKEVMLSSLNTIYEPYTVALEDIAEMWLYYAFTSQILPSTHSDLDKVLHAIETLKNSIQIK